MKIYLFFQDKIYNFMLPKEISGSYSFDANKNETSKLVNIEARDGKWVIYSVDGVNLVYDRRYVKELPLQDGTFYVVHRDDKNYLVYACSIENSKFYPYTFDKGFSMTISNSGGVNVIYPCPYINSNIIKLYIHEGSVYLEQAKTNMAYVNNKLITENQCKISNGDTINVFGFEIIYLNHFIFMNNPMNSVKIAAFDFGLIPYNNKEEEIDRNIIVQDKDLYDKKDYFSKSPRIRRIIETRKIKLSPPPNSGDDAELPMILTIGPMATMGVLSIVTVINLMMRVGSGEVEMAKTWPQFLSAGAMLASMLLWPIIMNAYNKKRKKAKEQELIVKYDEYLAEKEKEVMEEVHLQKDILIENLITVNECLNIINKRGIGFWDKRLDQNDFLIARCGMGNQPLDLEIEYPDQEFTIDEDMLKKRADAMVDRYRYINNVPVSYSFYDNKITAIMGDKQKSYGFTNNILLQLLTFYSYEDLKIVVLTNEVNEERWEYVRYLNHNFNNERTVRFFASDQDSAKVVLEFLENVKNSREGSKKDTPEKPYYLIIIDDYDSIKRFNIMKDLVEIEDEDNFGFSMIILEEKLNKLPSRCNNFISLGTNESAILKNSYEKQEQIPFKDEIDYSVNMLNLAKIMSNIPIEFEEGFKSLPNAISFLEMHEVGKVEQLNVLNRWNTNDSTMSLRAEVGVDEQNDLMYLDLHEKYHGPHGLIAGTTGSGKSEFIITYILSMCINYSPDDISFILIDYKGGGLALAFENEVQGIRLPHLAGTITNLDKAEMDRTLVSIDSEVKRRQMMFNEARDKLGESTIDIYKYQRFYKEGKVEEAIPHLFIICDEFAELKAQQPDFMDNLISVARIGRSLGVHLILATQKPSGVVNDQIWSNSKFKVCLKVQDEQDSKEMLKKPDAAHIKQAGRYYLQVGYDEYYALGQSGWCGAKYYPSDKIVKQVDKSINFINDCGGFIKSIQASSNNRGEAQGEQLGATMKLIIDVAEKVGKKAKSLWLPNIPEIILEDDIEKKYNFKKEPYKFEAVIGEYDAPELQEQGIVKYDVLEEGNTVVYGNDSIEREMLLEAIIYSMSKNYSPEEVNFYMLDFGSEFLKAYDQLPHFGGYATIAEENRVNNLFNLLGSEISKRKKLFANYGGEYSKYITSADNADKKLPLLIVFLNNYDSFKDNFDDLVFGSVPDVTRDSDRYGVVFVMTAAAPNSLRVNISQNFKHFYAYKLKDKYEYQTVFNKKREVLPREIIGRGIINNGDLHEFQTLSIVTEEKDNFIKEFVNDMIKKYEQYTPYLPLPILPDKLRLNNIRGYAKDLKKVPVGISKDSVEIEYVNFIANLGTLISANHFDTTIPFVKSLVTLVKNIENIKIIVIDPKAFLELDKNEYPNYYVDNLENVVKSLKDYVDKLITANSKQEGLIIINGVDDLAKKISDPTVLESFTESLKNYENFGVVFVETATKFKNYNMNKMVKNVWSGGNGVWISNGITNQTIIMTSTTRAMSQKIKDDMGYVINDNSPVLCKLLDFYTDE